MKKTLNNLLYLIVMAVVRLLAKTLFRLKTEGSENLPPEGPFIIASNHASFLDVGVIQSAVWRQRISWIAKKEVYDRTFLKPLHFLFDTVPINGALDRALEALDEGRVLGVFPEGTRSHDGKLKKAGAGIAILALKSGRRIVPVGIKGTFEAYPPGKRFFRPYPVTVRIGRPVSFKKHAEAIIDESVLNETKELIMSRIKELLG